MTNSDQQAVFLILIVKSLMCVSLKFHSAMYLRILVRAITGSRNKLCIPSYPYGHGEETDQTAIQ